MQGGAHEGGSADGAAPASKGALNANTRTLAPFLAAHAWRETAPGDAAVPVRAPQVSPTAGRVQRSGGAMTTPGHHTPRQRLEQKGTC